MADDRARWLAHATDLLEGLLAASEPHQLEAFHAYRIQRDDVSVADVAAARQVVLRVVAALDGSDPSRWPSIAEALDTFHQSEPASTDPHGIDHTQRSALDGTQRSAGLAAAVNSTQQSPGISKVVDSTLPAHAPAPVDSTNRLKVEIASARPASDAPAPVSVDETIALGELEGLEAALSASELGTAVKAPTPSVVLDLDKYAVLCAWTELQPERREALHEQYGLKSEEDRKKLDQHFEQLFLEDATMRTAFAQRLKMHLTFLRAGES